MNLTSQISKQKQNTNSLPFWKKAPAEKDEYATNQRKIKNNKNSIIVLSQNFIRNLMLKRKVCFCWKKWSFNLEGYPKKWTFASHGDFRRYLYEALVMSMPTD